MTQNNTLEMATDAQPRVILCVEDDPNLLASLEIQMMNNWAGKGFEVEVAENGEQALEMLKEMKAQRRELCLIISDQVMTAALPGDKLLVEAHALFPQAKKIMLTGQASMDNVANAVNKADLFRYLGKPWSDEDLRLTVESALDNYSLTRKLQRYMADLTRLNKTTSRFIQSRTTDALYQAVLEAALRFSRAERGLLLAGQGSDLTVVAEGRQDVANEAVALQVPAPAGTAYPAGLMERLLQKPETVTAVGAEVAALADSYFTSAIQSIYVLPLAAQDQLIGVLYLESSQPRPMVDPSQHELLDILAGAAAIAQENMDLIQGLEDKVHARTEQMEEMVRIASHDIRSPLTGVRQLTVLMQDPDIAEQKDQVIKFGGIISNSVVAVLKLVDDILDLSKLEKDPNALDRKPLQLKNWLKQIVDGFEPLCISKKLKLELQCSDGIALQADGGRLSQALNNLVANAVKYTPEGGTIAVVADQITEGGRNMARIQVADTGMGIPEADLPKIFQRFGATQRAGTQGEKGTGLGMSIVQRIVELHGGTISVASTVNKGTTFTVLLPL